MEEFSWLCALIEPDTHFGNFACLWFGPLNRCGLEQIVCTFLSASCISFIVFVVFSFSLYWMWQVGHLEQKPTHEEWKPENTKCEQIKIKHKYTWIWYLCFFTTIQLPVWECTSIALGDTFIHVFCNFQYWLTIISKMNNELLFFFT